MKRLISILCFAFILIVSCTKKPAPQPATKESIFTAQTTRNFNKWVEENVSNPTDFNVTSLDIAYQTDSLCVLNVVAIGENAFGGHVQNKLQYINIKINGSVYEWCDTDLKGDGVFSFVKDWFKLSYMEDKKDSALMILEKDTTRAGVIYRNAYVNACPRPALGGGRLIEE